MKTIYTSYFEYIPNIPIGRYFIVQVGACPKNQVGQFHIDYVFNEAKPDWNTIVSKIANKTLTPQQAGDLYTQYLYENKHVINQRMKHIIASAGNKEIVFVSAEKHDKIGFRDLLVMFFARQQPDVVTTKKYEAIRTSAKYAPCRIHVSYKQGNVVYKNKDGQVVDRHLDCSDPEAYINQKRTALIARGYTEEPIRDCVIEGQHIFLSKTFRRGSFTIVYRNANQNAPKFSYSFRIYKTEKRVFSCADIEQTMADLDKQITVMQSNPNDTFVGSYNILERETMLKDKHLMPSYGAYHNNNGWNIQIKAVKGKTAKRNNPYQVTIIREYFVEKTMYESELTLSKKIDQIRYYRHNLGYNGTIGLDINQRGEQIMSGLFTKVYENNGYDGVEQISYGGKPYLSFEELQKQSRGEIINPNKVSYTLNYQGQKKPIVRTRNVRSIMQDDEYTPMNSGRSWDTQKYRINREVEGTQAILAQIDKLIEEENDIKEEIRQLTEQQKTAKNDRGISAAKRKKLDEINANRKKQDELYTQLIGPLPKRGQKATSEQLPITASLENIDDANARLEMLKTKYFVKDKRYKSGLRPKK